MPATSEKQVFNFDNNFEQAARAVLVAGGYADAFIEGAQSADLPPSRIEVSFAAGEALNEAALLNGDHVYDYYSGRLTLRVVTFRPEDQPSPIAGVSNLHSEWSAAVRYLFQERRAPFNSVNLPFYSVQAIRPLATTRDLDPKWLEDYTRLEFAVEFGIRADAWPA